MSGSLKITDEERELLTNERKLPDRFFIKSKVYTWNEIPNGERMVRFGVDDNDYKIEEFSQLDEFIIGPNVSINKKGLNFKCKCIQDIIVEFELKEDNLSSKVIDLIIKLYNEHSKHFSL